jgi:hypothetical protein
MSGSMNGWNFARIVQGRNLISYSTGMSVRYEVSNREVHDVILTVGRKNVGQSEALPHPESDRPAPFPVVVAYKSVASVVALRLGMNHGAFSSVIVMKDGPKEVI